MAAIGSTVFALFLWTSILGVALVFVYEVYAVAAEYGWIVR